MHISIWIFCVPFICFALYGLLQSIYFWMFCFKHSITFESTYLLGCWFHRVDMLYIKFRFSGIPWLEFNVGRSNSNAKFDFMQHSNFHPTFIQHSNQNVGWDVGCICRGLNWLKHWINLEFKSVDLRYTYTWMF